jgi:hypothetical protein
MLKSLMENWQGVAAGVGFLVLAGGALFFTMRRRPVDPDEAERKRRSFLNRVGRIVEGQVLEIVDQPHQPEKPGGFFHRRKASLEEDGNGTRKLLYYTYSISGVTYETAQDITGLEERACLEKIVAGQSTSVKYDPSNPSNSILVADDWSGLH